MAVPTITSLLPTSGRTGGKFVVQVDGTGFRLPDSPPSRGPVPLQNPSVQAFFIGADGLLVEALRVDVAASTRLYIVAPSHDPGPCALRLVNIDSSGTPVPGETVTLGAAFEFKRPMLSGEPRTAERILARTVRTLRKLFVREVLEEVSITVHTDFDAEPNDQTNTVEVSKMPSLLMVGPQLSTNRFYSSNVKRTITLQDGGWAELRPVRVVDLSFTLLGLSEFTQELSNFQQEVAAFFERNPYLYVSRDPADLTAGTVRYEMALTSGPSVSSSPNDSNVRQFRAECVVRGVALDDDDMKIRLTRPIVEVLVNPGSAQQGTGAGGDVLGDDGTTWPVYFDPAIYQLALNEEE